ncbi:sodium-dependent phosphate transporter 2-like isoform X4 [Penaeus monodon]|uniref:sodium-dependent phosphate transporter 2-like isoform X4 n=1 Tax=Penaeus monodon TaxID=6687 RepID=UPI0018A7A102|nr:sodium-dependent phosphate transporter 2-like isoform X4 [Penaeus monodon]XP_037775973.1 sodium-dependent phosphate transporter 2-like isoform X4 [Penaeus monodon]
MEPFSEELLPFAIAGFFIAFVLAFGVGANDVANSFGTSVGSGVLTLRKACLLATVFEVLGAILIGYKVSDTVRKGILDVSLYNNTEKELMLGSLAALGGSAIWNLVATFFKLPISGTHTIVGATVGFSLCARGFDGVNWTTFGKIVGSWFISPVLSGIMSGVIYLLLNHFILKKEKPLEPGLKALPFIYGLTLLVNVFSVVHDGPRMLHFDVIPWWGAVITSLGVGFLTALFVQCIIVPRQRKAIESDLAKAACKQDHEVKFTFESADNSRSPTPPGQELSVIEKGVSPTTYTFNSSATETNGYIPAETKGNLLGNGLNNTCPSSQSLGITHNSSQVPLVNANQVKIVSMDELTDKKEAETDKPEVKRLFSFLQILTATFGSFAHGGNDVSNAIGPLIALWAIYTEGSVAQSSPTPIYILLYGGIGISVGLWVWGRRVIQTIGEDLTKVTASSGFTIEIGSAFTVLLASKAGLPISTTHCKVGSVVFVGWAKSSRQGVDWGLFRNIVIAWVVTVPLTAGISALLMLILQIAFL